MEMLTEAEILAQRQELIDFVLAEREAQRSAIWSVWNLPTNERVTKGWAVENLCVEQIEPLPQGRGFLITLSCAEDQSRFREGDAIKLTDGNPADPLATRAEGMLVASDGRFLTISVRKHRLQEGSRHLVLDPALIDLTERHLKALDEVVSRERGRRQVLPLLAGRTEPRFTLGKVDRLRLQAEGFTEKQVLALDAAAGTDLCFLVQGPPGTGKTRVLARLVRLLLEQKPNGAIFVTSFTHRAIDNALRAILKGGVDRDLVFKVGDKIPEADLPHAYDAAGIPAGRLSGPVVIGATPYALATRLANVEFDWVIADEASQMTLPLAIMAMIRADRWIFFGDDKQMPPVVQSMRPAEAITRSVFGRLRDRGYDIMLDETFRLPPSIAAWPSRQFYAEQLRSAGAAITRRLRLASIPVRFGKLLSPEPAAIFIDCEHHYSRSISSEEAEMAAAIVKVLDEVGFDLAQIAVVVPFRRQARLIREKIRAAGLTPAQVQAVVVDTVERMQGQEREVVIVSLTTSSLEFATVLQDFLLMPERLNVAITRASAKLIVLGSEAWLDTLPAELAQAQLFQGFLQQCARMQASELRHG